MEAVPTAAVSTAPIQVDDSVSFLNGDGHKIVCKSWRDDSEPRALVFVAHGFCEHCHVHTYDTLARALTGLGCYVFAHDHVGHGRSGGPRATIKSVETYVDDMSTHIDMRRAEFPNKPVYLIGFSMGGLTTVLSVQRRPKDFAGMVLLGPLLGFHEGEATWLKRTMARLLGWVIPSFPVSKLNLEKVSRDPAQVRSMAEDPLHYQGRVSAGWADAALTAIEKTHASVGAVEVPFLIQHGSADQICDPAESQEFFEKAPSKDKTIKIVNGGYHNLLTEPDGAAEQVLQQIVEWISARLPKQVLLS